MKILLTFLLLLLINVLQSQTEKPTLIDKKDLKSTDSLAIASQEPRNTFILSGNLPVRKGSWNAILFITKHIAVGGEFQYWNSARNRSGNAYGSFLIDDISTETIKKGKEYGLIFRYYNIESFPRLFLGLGIFTGSHKQYENKVESGSSIDFLTNNSTNYTKITNSFANFRSNSIRLSAGFDVIKKGSFSATIEGGLVLRKNKYINRSPTTYEPSLFPAMLRLMFGYKFSSI
jgi:hypothetical protein